MKLSKILSMTVLALATNAAFANVPSTGEQGAPCPYQQNNKKASANNSYLQVVYNAKSTAPAVIPQGTKAHR
jgi:hypothetical protein